MLWFLHGPNGLCATLRPTGTVRESSLYCRIGAGTPPWREGPRAIYTVIVGDTIAYNCTIVAIIYGFSSLRGVRRVASMCLQPYSANGDVPRITLARLPRTRYAPGKMLADSNFSTYS